VRAVTARLMDSDQVREFCERVWADSITPALQRYITIPNQSPAFDPHWQQHGHMERAVELIADWIRGQHVPGLQLNVVRLPGRTPLLFVDVPGDSADTVLLYGHLDKQPPLEGWNDGFGPWTPVLKDGRLYGRGAADDGYSAFAAITAILALKLQRTPCARCVLIIEACEESGSFDLPHYIDALKDRLGSPSLVICLDSGCGNYEQLWITASLRGLLSGNLTISTLTEGVHSGAASGIVPSTFRIVRQLLSRLEDERTGAIIPRDLYVEVPAERTQQIAATARALGDSVYTSFPFQEGTSPVSRDIAELLLNRTWRPQLEIIGAAGLPPLDKAGNVLRPVTTVKLSVRLPPTAPAPAAARIIKRLLESDPPYGAQVHFDPHEGATGWNAPPLTPWLEEALRRASLDFFGKEACYMGEGGTIPFMSMLGERFPHAQFMITGVLGPHANAHGPNEFLDLATGARLTACVARVLAEHYKSDL
jgi:acetylornithine deacetylase/succinyl-diaminopimelate desuccinylase-like protein